MACETTAALAAAPIPAAAGEGTAQEAAWAAAARGGDRDAFGELVRLHQRRVFRLAGRFFRRPEDVEDVAQETFLTAWRKLHTYRAEAPFEHWLTRVCLNCCYRRLRSAKPERELPLPDTLPAPDRGDPSAGAQVASLLARLDPRDRFLLQLLHGEGWSADDIARRLGWTRVNVKVRAHRARRRLQKLIEEDLKQ